VAVSIDNKLKMALESDELCELDEIARRRDRAQLEALKRLLSEPAPKREYRSRAIYALGRSGDPSAVPDIVRTLPELDEEGRITAMDALGRLGTKEALEAVARHADDPSPQVRKFVVRALNRIGGREAEEMLRAIARQDPEPWIKQLAAKRAVPSTKK
jgi:HEAT repeat protein